MIDIEKTRFLVTAWPDQRWPVELMLWIERLTHGKNMPADYRESIKKQDRTCARNTCIKKCALGSDPRYEWFVFADSDVRPDERSDAFLALEADIKACQVPMRSDTAWSLPNSFHESLWCTSRRVLEAIEAPWFMQGYTDDGCNLTGCICRSFQRKALAAGFTIAHGGWAEHDLDGSWC